MGYFLFKAAFSGVLIAVISEIARRNAALGALVASLPLISVIAMIWMWRDTGDAARIADHAEATFWYVLPAMPMFLVVPSLIRSGTSFWMALLLGCTLTLCLYLGMMWVGPRLGLRL
jgi:hypothetical protein